MKISGGLSNYLYCCSLPDDIQTENNEPRKVLLRYLNEFIFNRSNFDLFLKNLW
jgi:hypothetical protein